MTKESKTQKKNHLSETGLPFGKPKSVKRKEEKYPCLFPMGECWACGTITGLTTHHIFAGNPNRSLSEKYGLYVSLCIVCHTRIQLYKSVTEVERLKQEAQRRFEKVYGHDKFLEVFHKNYL